MADRKIILGVQYLRGIAALGVLLCHYGSSVNNKFLAGIFNYGQSGVLIFFMISGFIIVYSLTNARYHPKQFGWFLIKRSIRIDPSYYATIILTLLLFKLLAAIPSFKGEPIAFVPEQFFAHLFYVVPFTGYPFYNHVFWTLCVEFQFYLLIGMLYFAFNKHVYRVVFLVLFCATSFINFTNSYYLVFTYAPVFCLGMSLVDVVINKAKPGYILAALFLVVIAFKFSMVVSIMLLLCSVVILFVDKFNRPMFLLGEISYSLYLTHALTAIIVSGILKRFGADLGHNQLLWLPFQLLVALIFAYGFYQLIEKPSLRLSKKIFYKGNS